VMARTRLRHLVPYVKPQKASWEIFSLLAFFRARFDTAWIYTDGRFPWKRWKPGRALTLSRLPNGIQASKRHSS